MICRRSDQDGKRGPSTSAHRAWFESVVPSSQIAIPLHRRGRSLGVLWLAYANSARSYREDDRGFFGELGRTVSSALENATLYKEAVRATRMREDVLAVVSHDLRGPLQSIALANSIVGEAAGPGAPLDKHVRTIARSVERMEVLINDLLDLASIQAGRLAIQIRPVSAAGVIAEVLESHAQRAAAKRLHLAAAVDHVGDAMVACDRDRLLQVLGNLLGNAIKFCGEGASITIAGDRGERCFTFSVRDTGPGIAAETLPHLFDPYWSAREHANMGTGLGLFISKQIVDAHGGRLWVDSALGEGATFHVAIPLHERRSG